MNAIKSGLKILKEEIEGMSESQIAIEKSDKIVDIVEEILEFNRQNQQGQGSNIVTPEQMIRRLPVILAQLQAANNSQGLKNEIIQQLYSLHRSKKIIKTIYKHLISII